MKNQAIQWHWIASENFYENTNKFGNVCTIVFIAIMKKSGPKHVSKNDPRDSFTGHIHYTTFPTRPSDWKFLVTYDVSRCAREIMWSWTEWQRMTVPPQISGISRSLAPTAAAVIMSPFLTVIVRYTRWRQCSATFEHQLYKAEQRWLLQGGDRLTRKSGIEICLRVRVCNYLPICGECAAISQIHVIWSLVQGHTPVDCNWWDDWREQFWGYPKPTSNAQSQIQEIQLESQGKDTRPEICLVLIKTIDLLDHILHFTLAWSNGCFSRFRHNQTVSPQLCLL